VPLEAAAPQEASYRASARLGHYIKHVVIIVQENRSFENIFAGYPGADAPMRGVLSNGTTVRLTPATFNGPDVAHGWAPALADWNGGKMNGFNLPLSFQGPPEGSLPYAYLERNLSAPYWAMARQYVLADHMFPTEFGASFTSHIDLVASTTNLKPDLAEVNNPSEYPWGCDAAKQTYSWTVNPQHVIKNGPFPCFDQIHTLADTLDAANVSWKYYEDAQELWSAFDGIRDVREGSDWSRSVIAPETTVLSDPAAAKLASVTWVVPSLADSDHPGSNSGTGPSWVADVVNAIGRSPYWSSTAIIVLWDDWGGWYDNVPPPQLDFVGLGIRVPCIIISPYAKRHYVSHTQYEFGSVVKFVEQAFGLPPLGPQSFGYTDERANSLLDSFDFTQKPRGFTKIKAPYPASFFLTRKPVTEVPPDPE
jgi:phospholipase C